MKTLKERIIENYKSLKTSEGLAEHGLGAAIGGGALAYIARKKPLLAGVLASVYVASYPAVQAVTEHVKEMYGGKDGGDDKPDDGADLE
ncbi:hypothetical protein COV93_00870 [Candidatus Woesearchaeota archaeon CG11_big_fil_rev_8_21_14_0_20_43_8]|nr:MAG: hypothetical protein COV93_00870 [Candidatus Woesearchaeota archaeon CG11_big_fil_rev_8_21_14_0_20_43_8]PIO05226.1 MAG: hypothetical protein COT47_05690 [Candidatus Woesearchaeota archaeon CG08_land_8_20_14_0_20_43_7]